MADDGYEQGHGAPAHKVPRWQRGFPSLMQGAEAAMHNHMEGKGRRPGRLEYAGMADTAPSYHLWRCAVVVHGKVQLTLFDSDKLKEGSKLRRRLCSFCPDPVTAFYTNVKLTHNYCAEHGEKHKSVECTATTIEPCLEKLVLRSCPTCASLRSERKG